MTKKVSSSQRRKHEKIEDEFLRSRLGLADIENADSVTLEAYQILQETLVMLRKRRGEAGLPLDDVAETSGIDKAYLSRLENGKVLNPTFETLYRYAAAMGPGHVHEGLGSDVAVAGRTVEPHAQRVNEPDARTDDRANRQSRRATRAPGSCSALR